MGKSVTEPGASSDDREQTIAALLSRLADAIDPLILSTDISDAIFDRVAEFAEFAADEDLRRITTNVATHTLQDVWQDMRQNTAGTDLTPPRAALAWPVELVHRGVELHAMLRAYRVGHDLVESAWQSAISGFESDDDVRAEALLRASRFLFAYVDSVSVRLTRIYLEERTRHERGAAVPREEMIRALLGGAQASPEQATAALRYEVTGAHVGFIVWREPSEPGEGHASALESVAGRIGAAVGGGGYMLVPVGNWVVWGWSRLDPSSSRPPRPALPLPDGVRVALGDPAEGPAGLVRTHQEAVEARRVARLVGYRTRSTVFHHDVALIVLLTADPAAAERFVRSELGRLADGEEAMTRLRTTMQVYLEENLSPVRAARRLDVNKNTVVYRMEKAEEILGHPVLERRSELEAALLLANAAVAPNDSTSAQ